MFASGVPYEHADYFLDTLRAIGCMLRNDIPPVYDFVILFRFLLYSNLFLDYYLQKRAKKEVGQNTGGLMMLHTIVS